MPSLRVAAILVATTIAACGELVGIRELSTLDAAAEDGPPDVHVGIVEDTGAPVSRDDAAAPPGVKRVFVTSSTSDGILGGILGADARCAEAATRGRLDGGRWVAWLSDATTNAIDRIEHTGPYHLLDGRQVVANRAQLASGSLTTPILLDEYGTRVNNAIVVWTGTLSNGLGGDHCDGWSKNGALVFGVAGTLDQATARWTQNGGPGPGFPSWGCQTQSRLYCFEL